MKKLVPYLLTSALLVVLGCGGGGGLASPKSPPSGGTTPLASGAHTLGLSVTLAATAKVPVSGLSLSLKLPQGVTVATGDGDPGVILDAALSAGSGITGSPVLSGAYSATTRQAKLVLVHTPTAAWSGEYLRLKVTVQPGTAVTEADLQVLNAVPAGFKVVGFDTMAHGTVVLTGQATHAMKVLN